MQSPLLDQYNQDGIVTPQLQQALDMARLKLPQAQLPGAQPPAGPTPLMRNLAPPGQAAPAIQRQPEGQPGLVAPGGQAQQPASPAPSSGNPDRDAHLAAYNKLLRPPDQGGGSGIDQVKNPILRGLLRIPEAIGSTFLPSLTSYIPGTGLHHEGLVRGAEAAVNQDTANAKENAGTAETEARTASIPGEDALKKAQADEANARTESLRNPPKGWKESAEPAIDPDHPELGPQHFFYNESDPTQKQFGGTMAAKPTAADSEPHYEKTEDGSVIAMTKDKDGKVGYQVVYHGDPKIETDLTEVNGHRVLVNKKTGATIQDLGVAKTGGADHGQNIMGPDGTLIRLEPGQKAPEGFTTPTQAGTQNTLTVQQRNAAARGTLLHEQTPAILSEIDSLKEKLGPVAGRWDEFMQGKVGASDPDLAGLRADLLMYSSSVALMHAQGRLPENLREEFDGIINNPKQNFDNLKAIIKKIDEWTAKNPGVKSNGAGNIPTVKSQADFDKLPKGAEYMEDGKKYRKP